MCLERFSLENGLEFYSINSLRELDPIELKHTNFIGHLMDSDRGRI